MQFKASKIDADISGDCNLNIEVALISELWLRRIENSARGLFV